MKVKIVSAEQSPTNARRWQLELSCGHAKWILARKPPKKKFIDCMVCEMAR
jgi:hypothetical protein